MGTDHQRFRIPFWLRADREYSRLSWFVFTSALKHAVIHIWLLIAVQKLYFIFSFHIVAQILSLSRALSDRMLIKEPQPDNAQMYAPVVTTSRVPYKTWNNANMERAIMAVQKGELSIRRASEIYSIPKSSLHDRISGKVTHGATSGPDPYLTATEEAELVQFLTKCASMGFARSKKQIFAIVDRALELKGRTVKASNGWWQSFRKRHPNMILRTSEPLSYIRAISSSPDIISQYYDLLENTIVDNNLQGNHLKYLTWMRLECPLIQNLHW